MQCLCPKFLFLAKAKENFCFIGAFNCWKREVHAPSKGAKDSILMTIILQKLSNGNNFAVCESMCVCARTHVHVMTIPLLRPQLLSPLFIIFK